MAKEVYTFPTLCKHSNANGEHVLKISSFGRSNLNFKSQFNICSSVWVSPKANSCLKALVAATKLSH